MKSVDQEKIVQLFESNVPAMRLPVAFSGTVKAPAGQRGAWTQYIMRVELSARPGDAVCIRPLCGCCRRGSRDAGSRLGARLTR